MYTKYPHNISYGQRVIECTSFPLLSSNWFKGDNSKAQLGGATILAPDTPSLPDIYMYTIYHYNISKGMRVIELTSFPL